MNIHPATLAMLLSATFVLGSWNMNPSFQATRADHFAAWIFVIALVVRLTAAYYGSTHSV